MPEKPRYEKDSVGPPVVYVSQEFPSLTTTFVYREVRALRQLGVAVRPISTWRPQAASLSAEAAQFVEETFYLFPLPWLDWIKTHLRYLATRPGRYLDALARLTLFNREPLPSRLRSLVHFAYAVSASAEIERCGARHIHADYALNAATVALVAARLTDRPFSFTAHAADIFVNPILLREKIGAAAFVVAISEYNRRHLLQVAGPGCPAAKVHVIHCGLDLAQFPGRVRVPAEHARMASPRILGVGRLVEKKGFRYLVEACYQLMQAGRAFECEIVGDGPQAPALRDLVQHLGLEAQVHLSGALPQERIRERLSRADVFALPCVVSGDHDQDGIPVVLMEAMAMGIPVISTHLSGIPELVEDGVSGLLVPPADGSALAQALSCLLWTSPERRDGFARAGRAVVERDFDALKNAVLLAELFGPPTKQPCQLERTAPDRSRGAA